MGWNCEQRQVHVQLWANSVLISTPFSGFTMFVDQRCQSGKRIRKWGVEMKSATEIISWHLS